MGYPSAAGRSAASARTGDYTTRGLFTVPAVSVNGYYDTPVNVKLYFEGKFSVGVVTRQLDSSRRLRIQPRGRLRDHERYPRTLLRQVCAPCSLVYIKNSAICLIP